MSGNSAKNDDVTRNAKRNRFRSEAQSASNRRRWIVLGAVGLAIVGIAVGARWGGLFDPGAPSGAESPTAVSVESNDLPSGAESPTAVSVDSNDLPSAFASLPLAAEAATRNHAPYPLVTADASGEVRLPAAAFDDSVARHFTYVHNGRPIEFFVLKSDDGTIRAAFNACDVCYGGLLGYRQDGSVMVCINCGRRFPANQINLVQGGCNPAPLARQMEGDDLVIRVADIVVGTRFF